ncbi:hypothetical protein Vretifemale_12798 [Volvox reticuliferus]|uniref:Uncharacterized protein n=1 Tax=Volvox reticuliferus TaxID=1737510 RepID=A0A8J4CJ60_9CHLO|nr:hypothetical protein Vretifemale_12798 [Volvox reticuliferus]
MPPMNPSTSSPAITTPSLPPPPSSPPPPSPPPLLNNPPEYPGFPPYPNYPPYWPKPPPQQKASKSTFGMVCVPVKHVLKLDQPIYTSCGSTLIMTFIDTLPLVR